jgi:hypothetical protein
MSEPQHIHPIIQGVLEATRQMYGVSVSTAVIAESDSSEFEATADIGQCPECGCLVINGVCQGMICKERLL